MQTAREPERTADITSTQSMPPVGPERHLRRRVSRLETALARNPFAITHRHAIVDNKTPTAPPRWKIIRPSVPAQRAVRTPAGRARHDPLRELERVA